MKLIRNILFAMSALAAVNTTAMAGMGQETAESSEPIIVFAASSLSLALDHAAGVFEREHNRPVRISLASSAALARQIAAGAPASVFLSADNNWIDTLLSESEIAITNKAGVAGNRLVLAAQRGRYEPGHKLADYLDALAGDRLAIGDPQTSPLGHYTNIALDALGLWAGIRDRVAPIGSAQATVNFLKAGGASMAIIYASALVGENNLVILSEIDRYTHPAITYIAVSFDEKGATFVDWLLGNEAQAILARYGLLPLP
jgi:molybdate transport system substrate-binding protein